MYTKIILILLSAPIVLGGVVAFFVCLVKQVKLTYKVLRYGQIFSVKDVFMVGTFLTFYSLPFGLKFSQDTLKELKFDNEIPKEYFENSIVKSQFMKVIRCISCVFFVISTLFYTWYFFFLYTFVTSYGFIIGSFLGGFLSIMSGFMFNLLLIFSMYFPYQFFTFSIVYLVLLIPSTYMYFKNLYNIIKNLQYSKWQDIFNLILLSFVLILPFVGLTEYKNIIENKLKFKEGFDVYYRKNISENKIVNLGFYSYGFAGMVFFILFVLSFLGLWMTITR